MNGIIETTTRQAAQIANDLHREYATLNIALEQVQRRAERTQEQIRDGFGIHGTVLGQAAMDVELAVARIGVLYEVGRGVLTDEEFAAACSLGDAWFVQADPEPGPTDPEIKVWAQEELGRPNHHAG